MFFLYVVICSLAELRDKTPLLFRFRWVKFDLTNQRNLIGCLSMIIIKVAEQYYSGQGHTDIRLLCLLSQ